MPGHLASPRAGVSSWGVNDDALIELLSAQLYPDGLAFVRELIANAIDATHRRPNSNGRVTLRLTAGARLEVTDDGCGLSIQDVYDFVGTIGASGTKARYQERGEATAAPIGRFGVGLLSTRNVATRVELLSQSEHEAEGIHWIWDGGRQFECSRTAKRAAIGTTVVVHFRDDSLARTLDERSLARWVRENMTFVDADVYLEGSPLPLTVRATPWRSVTNVLEQSKLQGWAREHGLTCGRFEYQASRRFGGGGVVVGWPSAQGTPAEFSVFRSGVRVPSSSGILPKELSWLSVLADLPGVDVTLDRSSLTPDGQTAAKREVEALVSHCMLQLATGDEEDSTAWWSSYRRDLFGALAFVFARVGEDTREAVSATTPRLCSRLRFDTPRGPRTLDELAAHARREQLQVAGFVENGAESDPPAPAAGLLIVRWGDRNERAVFHFLAEAMGLRVAPWSAPAKAIEAQRGTLWSASASGLAKVVQKVLDRFANQRIQVSLANDFANDAELARWQRAPSAWVEVDETAFAPQTVRRSDRSLELKLNADSPALQLLGSRLREAKPNQALGLAWGLVGLALAKYDEMDPNLERKQHESLFSLAGIPGPSIEDRRCFVGYDWQLARAEFEAVSEALSAEPFRFNVIDAASELRGEHILSNLLEVMRSCNCFVSVLTPGQGNPIRDASGLIIGRENALAINANVLLEAGIAMALGRPHIVCTPSTLTLPADFDGLLRVAYASASDLASQLPRHAKRIGLDGFGSRWGHQKKA